MKNVYEEKIKSYFNRIHLILIFFGICSFIMQESLYLVIGIFCFVVCGLVYSQMIFVRKNQIVWDLSGEEIRLVEPGFHFEAYKYYFIEKDHFSLVGEVYQENKKRRFSFTIYLDQFCGYESKLNAQKKFLNWFKYLKNNFLKKDEITQSDVISINQYMRKIMNEPLDSFRIKNYSVE